MPLPKYNDFTFYSWSRDSWIADSGASVHIANQRDVFTYNTPCERVINVAGGLPATLEDTGVVHVRGLIEVLYVLTTYFCLIS